MATVVVPVHSGRVPYSVVVTLEEISFELFLRWNPRDGHWFMSVLRAGVAVLEAIKLVESSDLLSQFGHKQTTGDLPPGTWQVSDTQGLGRDPDTETLGVSVMLLYVEST